METEGQVVLSTWHIGPEISIEYCVRLPSSPSLTTDSNPTNVADVFVSLNQAVKLLTLVSGSSTAKVKPPNFKTVWTISLDGGKHLDVQGLRVSSRGHVLGLAPPRWPVSWRWWSGSSRSSLLPGMR